MECKFICFTWACHRVESPTFENQIMFAFKAAYAYKCLQIMVFFTWRKKIQKCTPQMRAKTLNWFEVQEKIIITQCSHIVQANSKLICAFLEYSLHFRIKKNVYKSWNYFLLLAKRFRNECHKCALKSCTDLKSRNMIALSNIVCVYDERSSIICAVLEYSLHFQMKKKCLQILELLPTCCKKIQKCAPQMRAKTLHGFEVTKHDCSLKYRLCL